MQRVQDVGRLRQDVRAAEIRVAALGGHLRETAGGNSHRESGRGSALSTAWTVGARQQFEVSTLKNEKEFPPGLKLLTVSTHD